MATLAAVTNIPALALLGEDGNLERSTEVFRRWYADNEAACRESPELVRVLEGQANAAVLKLDGVAVDIAAMADRDGGRHVLLTLPTSALPSLGDAGEALLDGALDESPALVWLKDLDGRYVRVNARFTGFLGTSEERLLGRTDAELPAAETVDGPRAQEREEGVEEPLQLEYFVGPYQGREGLVVLRFPVSDRQGAPSLVCGVAAPSSEAQVARSEAARLLRVERWSRLDAESVRAELLADWGLLPDARGRVAAAPASEQAPGSAEQEAAVAEARAERATAVAERDAALTANDKLAGDLETTRSRVAELERALETARADSQHGDAEARLAERAAELDRALVRERERAEELERTLALVRQRLGDDAEAARAEVQRARADAEAARTEVQRARADAEAARTDLQQARADADAVRGAAGAERESAASARAELERELGAAREQLAALERQQGADDSGVQLRASEKARIVAETALTDAIGERDAALKAQAALSGELEQERKQVAALREGAAAGEERLRELTGELERARVRAAGVEPAQARVQELERELRVTVMRADKAEVELQVSTQRAEQAEAELERGRARVQALEDKLEQDRVRMAELEAERRLERARIDELENERRIGSARVGELQDERKADQARIAELVGERDADRARVEELEAELERARANAEEAEDSETEAVDAEAPAGIPTVAELARLETPVDSPAGQTAAGVSWHPTAKRTLSASLARESVWRNVLKETVEVLGSEGGWDTVTAWLPGESNDLGCAATWTAHRGLDRFEALTWDVPVNREGSLLDQALQAPHLTWLTDIDAVDDARLQTAAAHGMSSALLLPVRSGTNTIGLLELLTHDSIEPDAQIALSLEASALQLGRFGHLLSLGKSS
ncbi:MAG: PAS domain-containing protein [Solirubrobacterales bacterium]|nr:PAS domain-containing protein [Solirubrobacterales bacterium]